MSYRPLAPHGLTRPAKNLAVCTRWGPQNRQGSLARRVIPHELRPQFLALRRPRNLPPTQTARPFRQPPGRRAADEASAAATIDEPAAAERIAANQGKYDGREEAGRQV